MPSMKAKVRKIRLREEQVAPLYEREEAMRIFAELLRRGKSFYPHDTAERFIRVCKITPIREG